MPLFSLTISLSWPETYMPSNDMPCRSSEFDDDGVQKMKSEARVKIKLLINRALNLYIMQPSISLTMNT
ncbi:hypothetical protein SDC9_197516 [bioreactor metagenome]|uniref:Uncharacterized protein n=1 Tax=bioreactor metagenome TaxID=1076179 RepID=A0A645IGC3_9ZZZZ